MKEVLRFIRMLGFSIYDWLERIYRDDKNSRLAGLIDDFLRETKSELWTDGEAFRQFTRDRANVKKLIAGEIGANLIFKYRSLALLDYADEIADVARRALAELLEDRNAPEEACALGDELVTYGHARLKGLFESGGEDPEHAFRFDVLAFSDRPQSTNPSDYRLRSPSVYRFTHTAEQTELLARYTSIYGTSLAGLSRILAKVYVRKLFRQPMDITGSSTLLPSSRDLRFGQAALTGLNEFGG